MHHLHRPLPLALLALALGLAVPLTARAEDNPSGAAVAEPPTIPAMLATATTARLAALPPPDAARDFVFEGWTEFAGLPNLAPMRGAYRLRVEANEEEGRRVWRVRESMSVDFTPVGMQEARNETDAWLDARLTPIRGAWSESDPQGNVTKQRIDEGAPEGSIRYIAYEGALAQEPADLAIPKPGSVVSGISSFLLFLHLTLPESGASEGAAWSITDPGEEQRFESFTWKVDPKGEFEGKPAIAVTSKRRKANLEAWFDPTSKRLLLARMKPDGEAVSITIRPGTAPETPEPAPAPAEEDGSAKGRSTPQSAAIDAMIGFGAKDADLIDSVTHWPSAYAALEGQTEMSMDEFRKAVLHEAANAEFDSDPSMVRVGIAMMKDQFVVAMEGEDRATVTYPSAFSLAPGRYGRIDGRWYLISMPAPR